ncbi:hypothetical protein KP509_27G060000 [Ceratopteris richardii]|uniref:Uncharacterized protein n=1 Tax=Ceratopteris richardii TaxID=49495 RepID=A0A8T2RJA9_CERRI|nr:hypothetical protein KP509_27G060000 [Ceratopteris richardii]
MRWERIRFKVKTDGRSLGRRGGTAGPGKRWGHTCNSVKNGRFLYVFGGYGKDNRQTNDVHVFDTVKQTWSKPMVKGTPPSPRDSHSCTTVGTSLFVFGGTDGKTPLKDLYVLDTATNVWSKPQIDGEGPAPREGHSAALIGHILFIFGGCGKTADESEEIYFNDLFMLDTVKLHWTKALTKGTPPTPRDSHTCSAWNNNLIVLGGEDASDSYLSDVHLLDTDIMQWREIHVTGDMLMPRAGHAMVALRKCVFVFGGFTDDRKLYDDLHMLNLETGLCTKVIPTGAGPCKRFSVAGDCIDVKSGVLIFIGGCNENLEALDDMYYLDTELHAEKWEDGRSEKDPVKKEPKRKRQDNQIVVKSPEVEKEITKEVKQKMIPPPLPPSPPGVGLYELKPVEEKIFEARITDIFHYGYTIESMIDGKKLRGLLFSYKPGFAHAVHAYLMRKKSASDGAVTEVQEARKPKLKIARPPKHVVSIPDGQGTPSQQTSFGESTSYVQSAALPTQQSPFMSHQMLQAQPQPAPLLHSQMRSSPQPQLQHPTYPISQSQPPPQLQQHVIQLQQPTNTQSPPQAQAHVHPQSHLHHSFSNIHTHHSSTNSTCSGSSSSSTSITLSLIYRLRQDFRPSKGLRLTRGLQLWCNLIPDIIWELVTWFKRTLVTMGLTINIRIQGLIQKGSNQCSRQSRKGNDRESFAAFQPR